MVITALPHPFMGGAGQEGFPSSSTGRRRRQHIPEQIVLSYTMLFPQERKK
jgi:hypothetical protein